MKITFNKTNLKKINQTMQDILLDTAEAVKTDLIQSQTMPFGKTRKNKAGKVVYQGGTLQNDSTFVDDKRVIRGIVSIVSDTPYARKVYFDPEITIQQEENPNAKQYWFEDYISGNKKELPFKYYRKMVRRRMQ